MAEAAVCCRQEAKHSLVSWFVSFDYYLILRKLERYLVNNPRATQICLCWFALICELQSWKLLPLKKQFFCWLFWDRNNLAFGGASSHHSQLQTVLMLMEMIARQCQKNNIICKHRCRHNVTNLAMVQTVSTPMSESVFAKNHSTDLTDWLAAAPSHRNTLENTVIWVCSSWCVKGCQGITVTVSLPRVRKVQVVWTDHPFLSHGSQA